MASLAGSKSVRKRLGHPRYQKVVKPENVIEVPEPKCSHPHVHMGICITCWTEMGKVEG